MRQDDEKSASSNRGADGTTLSGHNQEPAASNRGVAGCAAQGHNFETATFHRGGGGDGEIAHGEFPAGTYRGADGIAADQQLLGATAGDRGIDEWREGDGPGSCSLSTVLRPA